MSRQEQREGFDASVRIALLERDADSSDSLVAALREELKNTNRILMGLLVSISTAAILLAVNLAIGTV